MPDRRRIDMNAFAKIRKALNTGDANDLLAAMDALAELERAAAQPVAYQYAHPYFGGGKIWREEQRWNGHTSDEARALYAALPTPVAEIRESVEVDDEIARKLWREWFDAGCMTGLDTARFWLRVWQRELGPTLGMVPPDARADARIAELERECAQWRDELRIYRESEDARIAELEAKVARMRVDSERYRFLREQAPSVPFECKRHVAVHVHDWARALDQNARFNMWSYMQLSGKRLDSEIDAARANGGEG